MTLIVTFCHIVEPNISSHEEAMQTACVRVCHIAWRRKAGSIRLIIRKLRHQEASMKLNVSLTRTRR